MNKKILKIVILILIIIIEVLSVPKVDYGAETNLKIGDVNGDGTIDSRDTLKILEHIAASNIQKIKQKHSDWILKGDKLKVADINEDGLVDSRDTIKELEYIAATTIPKIGQKHSNWKKYIEDKWKIEATGISLNNTNIKIAKGKITKLTATITPKNVTNKVVKWSSSNEKIATVDGLGNVTGKDEGTTFITATTNNGKTAKAQITVGGTGKQQPVKTTKSISKVSIKLSSTSVAYNGKVQTPGVTLKDGNTTLKKGTDYTVSYSNNKKVGKATITIAGKGNYTGKVTKKFTITKAPMSRVSVLGIEDKAYTGKQITQNIKVKDGNTVLKNGTDYTVKYQANKNIGQNAKIMIVGKGNYTGTIIRTFSIVSIKGTKIITSAPLYRNVEKGKYVQLTAKVSPDNATYKTITWSSSNTKVATVDNKGKIHIVGHGTAKITATQKENKLTATYTIVGYTPPKNISFTKSAIKLKEEEKQKLTVTFNPKDVSSKEITWTSSAPNVASVDISKTTNGTVTIIARAKGTATITATHKYGKTATCVVTVTEKPSFDLEHAIKVTSDPHAKEHEHLPWHGSTVGKHAGMIGAYVEAINILNGTNYRLKEVYNKILSAHPNQKTKNEPVYENEDINKYYNIKVSRAPANVNEIKKALAQGKLVAEIVDTTKWRDEKGKLWGKIGRHTGLIFYFDGKYFHMKSSVKLNAIYTESQLKEWLGNTKTKLIIYSRR